MRQALFVILAATGCGPAVLLDNDDDDSLAIARDVCELMPTCASSLVTVEECVDIQLGCRDLLSEPEKWDEHMAGCVELGGCEEGDSGLVDCVAEAPRPTECEGGGRP